MKKMFTICLFCMVAIGFAQEKQPLFSIEGDLVKATYFYEDGAIKTQGYFKDKKLTGEWVSFDQAGNKIQLAYYNNGKKVGKWFFWTEGSLKEINYENNAVASVNEWKNESNVANANR